MADKGSIHPNGESAKHAWKKESYRLLDLAQVGFETSLQGLPSPNHLPASFEFGSVTVIFNTENDIRRIEREISDAFFLRLKGLTEAQFKRYPVSTKPNWKNVESLLSSLGVPEVSLSAEDRIMLGRFCAIRNCIAHNDGRVDATCARLVPELEEGKDVWLERIHLRKWFDLIRRVVSVL